MPDQETANNEETSVYLHAELLPHIRQITLQISYPSHLSPQAGSLSPIFHLSNTARLVTVSFPRPFEPITHTIVLPARVSDAARQALETPRVQLAKGADSDGMPRREISFRLSLANDEEPLKSKGEVMDEFVPWTARDMSPSVRVGCRDCKADILRSFHCCASDSAAQGDSMGGWTWKDLPSGNWAEMMDFWHCHKPDPREESNGMTHGSERLDGMSPDEHNSQVKGYGAANSVVSTPGTILVDVATFLVSEVDCANLKKIESSTQEMTAQSTSTRSSIQCEICSNIIGVEDPFAQGWRLFKASCAVLTDPESGSWETHPSEVIIAAQLLEMVERESARRCVIHCEGKDGLLLWVFNPDLQYSNSGPTHRVAALRAMKVLFQSISAVDELLHPERGKASPWMLEELELPLKLYRRLDEVLRRSNEMMPVSARKFQKWRVGLLDRFERPRS